MKVYPAVDLEDRIAMQTEAGREMLRVRDRIRAGMTGPEKIAKSFELTELTRQTMRAGIRSRNPDADEDELQRLYVDAVLRCHGLSLAELDRMREEESRRRSAKSPARSE